MRNRLIVIHPFILSSIHPFIYSSIHPFIQEQDEETQEVNTTLQELCSQTEKKSSRSEASEEEEDEGQGERLPLSISMFSAPLCLFRVACF